MKQHKTGIHVTMTVIILSIATFFANTQSACAQRTAEHQMLFSTAFTTQSFSGVGFEASWGRYLKTAYWDVGFFLRNPSIKISGSSNRITYSQLAPYGSFMFRLYGTPTRLFNLYGGADAFFGLQVLDMYAKLSSEAYSILLNSGYSATRFIYGGGLRLETEVFPLPFIPSLAVTAHGRLGLTGNTAIGEVFGYELGIGLRYNY